MNSYSDLDSRYKHVKQHFEIEFYICNIVLRRVRDALTTLRVSSHGLRVESGRCGRDRIEKAQRKCIYCTSNDIEDELHFVIKCSFYNDIRIRFIFNYSYTKSIVLKCTDLVRSNNKRQVNNLGKFINLAFQRRTSANL